MTGVFMNHSTPYDPFSTSYLVRGQEFQYSPTTLLDPLEGFDFGTNSPTSPALDKEWTSPLDSVSSEDIFKTESFDSPVLTSISSASPAINPMDLSALPLEDDLVSFGGSEALVDNGPLFPSPQMARAQIGAPIATDATRQSERMLKRKSTSSYSASSSRHSSASPPPATRRALSGARDHTTTIVPLPPKKTAHNMIEKRYRNNLNDKISALRDAVPALRVMVHRLEAQNVGSDEDVDRTASLAVSPLDFDEDLGGLAPAHKLNKATILSKATEYILHLERKNKALVRENQGLKGKVEGFEMLMMNGATRTTWC